MDDFYIPLDAFEQLTPTSMAMTVTTRTTTAAASPAMTTRTAAATTLLLTTKTTTIRTAWSSAASTTVAATLDKSIKVSYAHPQFGNFVRYQIDK